MPPSNGSNPPPEKNATVLTPDEQETVVLLVAASLAGIALTSTICTILKREFEAHLDIAQLLSQVAELQDNALAIAAASPPQLRMQRVHEHVVKSIHAGAEAIAGRQPGRIIAPYRKN
jgi:predicted cation transporter